MVHMLDISTYQFVDTRCQIDAGFLYETLVDLAQDGIVQQVV